MDSEVLITIPATSHLVLKRSSACWDGGLGQMKPKQRHHVQISVMSLLALMITDMGKDVAFWRPTPTLNDFVPNIYIIRLLLHSYRDQLSDNIGFDTPYS